jgi:hypothetical protein
VELKLNVRAYSKVYLGFMVLKPQGKLSLLDLQGGVIDFKYLAATELIECGYISLL